jgi:hypothetical protein
MASIIRYEYSASTQPPEPTESSTLYTGALSYPVGGGFYCAKKWDEGQTVVTRKSFEREAVPDYISKYNFAESLLDSTGINNLNGNITYTTDRYGNTNKSAYFDSKADVLNLTSEISSSQISVSFWYRFDGTSGNWNTLLCRNGSGYHHLLISDGSYYIGFYNSGWHQSSKQLTVGQTYHIVLTKNGSNCKIYINTELVLNSNSSFDNSTYPLYLIGNYEGYSQGSLGAIGTMRLYTRELTASEVTEIYNNEKA